jgi:elongator complex protein 1
MSHPWYKLMVAYTMAQHPAKAMKAYEKAHAWRELFTMAKEQQLDEETISAMVERVTGKPRDSPQADQ